ncbi:MAG: hypothetical protein WA817_02500 [Candidatus Acidiferrum sp.]|jgi:hypothetical protein
MKILRFLMLTLLFATSALAARHWKTGEIELTSETKVSWKLWGEKTTIHYTIETPDMIYFAEYAYKPNQHHESPPQIEMGSSAKIAIEGHHAYVLDVSGKEVKLHIIKKVAKK